VRYDPFEKEARPLHKINGFEERCALGYKKEPFNSTISFAVKTWEFSIDLSSRLRNKGKK
jgi:hypothetical protein